jgi:hypothetical protein
MLVPPFLEARLLISKAEIIGSSRTNSGTG